MKMKQHGEFTVLFMARNPLYLYKQVLYFRQFYVGKIFSSRPGAHF